jgi:hypothetical protein
LGGQTVYALVSKLAREMTAYNMTCCSACGCVFGFGQLDVHRFKSLNMVDMNTTCHFAIVIVTTGTCKNLRITMEIDILLVYQMLEST